MHVLVIMQSACVFVYMRMRGCIVTELAVKVESFAGSALIHSRCYFHNQRGRELPFLPHVANQLPSKNPRLLLARDRKEKTYQRQDVP